MPRLAVAGLGTGIDSVELYYTTDTNAAYNRLLMYDVFGDHYEANIPAQPAGTEVFYYIKAYAKGGKQQVRPITAPAGFYNFKVLGTTAVQSQIRNPKSEILSPFPNPSKGITCLPVTTLRTEKIVIDCLNVLGEKMQSIYEGETKIGDNKYFINTENFSAGVYFIRYKIGEAETTKRIVVK